MLQIIIITSKCLLSDYLDNCLFCSYDEFPNHSKLCLKKSLLMIQRKVFIVNTNITNDLSNYFDALYKDFSQALISENKIIKAYNESKIVFYFSEGDHKLEKDSFSLETQTFFFHRDKTTINIKPLYCDEYQIDNLCINRSRRPKIKIDFLYFAFYISNKFYIENIDFEIWAY